MEMKIRKFILIGIFLLTLIPGKAQTDMGNAQALYIYNFMRYIKWPENSVGEKYVIGVVGNSSTYNSLKKLTSGRKVGIKSIEVVIYQSVTDIVDCQILVVARNKNSEMQAVSERLAGKSCLIIGEISGNENKEACIYFRVVDNKLKFAINEENTKRQQLVVSKTLFDMAI